jgi:hypothetical protein
LIVSDFACQEAHIYGDCFVQVRQTPDPEWTGVLTNREHSVPATIRHVYPDGSRSWQVIEAPGPGTWTLQLWYEGRAAKAGLIASAVAWTVWLLLWFRPWAWKLWRKRTEPA